MSKLWQKDYTLDSLIEAFTVGSDYQLDRELAAADCLGSAAHAQMLQSIGILSHDELDSAKRGLQEILDLQQQDQFDISPADEDCHTAIEQYLTNSFGDVGKKIHTGRSRNDQIQTALRVWMKDFLIAMSAKTLDLVDVLTKRASEHAGVPMPGRTHMQVAMPSSVGLWAGAYAEELRDETNHLFSILELIDQSPLGSAASYGVPLPLDRELSAQLMGFSRVQNNVLYANNSRGKFEAIIVDGLDYICLTLSKIAQDLIVFSMPEFGYFSLPAELCSGSSIMPQKKNPDALELTRSRSSLVSACAFQIKNSIRSLPSGYNRDFQDTKEPLLRAAHSAYQCVMVMELTIEKLEIHQDRLLKAFTPEIYATDKALELVQGGMSFRDAYRQVGLHLEQVDVLDPAVALKGRTSTGTAGNLGLETMKQDLSRLREVNEAKKLSLEQALAGLFGDAYRTTSFFRRG
ncbi:MAG: argininosuccinate lyase [Spirochaetota bacterium]